MSRVVFNSQAEFEAAVEKIIREKGLTPDKKAKKRAKTTLDFEKELEKIPGLNSKIKKSFESMDGVIDKIFGAGGTAFGGVEAFGQYGKDKYDAIQKQFGGIRDIDNAATETAKQSAQAVDDIYANFLGNAGDAQGMMIELNGESVNAASAFYEHQSEIANNYLAVRMNLAGRQSTMFNKMSREDQTKISMMEKGFGISNDKVAALFERQVSRTGEASNKIFDEIGAHSAAVSEVTGISFQEIAQGITNIITDVERFGNVQVDEAARIAAALDQLGMSYQGFGGMVDKFMNFDQSAESLGNLTTVFGVHFDAMEMMQLANEDQEEFLHRMRDAFLDSGKAVEDMTLAEKKLASQQLGMSIQDFENFMQEDREITDLTSVSAAVDPNKGFEEMTKNMVQVETSGERMKQFMIDKVMDPTARAAYATAESLNAMKKAMMVDPQKMLPGYQEFKIAAQTSVNATVGAGAFDDNFGKELDALHDFAKTKEANLADTAGIFAQLEEAKKAENFTFKDYMKIAASLDGSAEMFEKATGLLKDRVDRAQSIDDKLLAKGEYQKMLKQKQTIDMQEFQKKQKAEFQVNPGGAEAGVRVDTDQSTVQKQIGTTAEEQSQQTNSVPSPTPTPTPDNPEVAEVSAVGLFDEDDEALEIKNIQASNEKYHTAQVEANAAAEKRFNKMFNSMQENTKNLLANFETKFKNLEIGSNIYLDGKKVGAGLMNTKLDNGATFALNNTGGDTV